jgi:ATP-binding protein involved in chromosome partitioning
MSDKEQIADFRQGMIRKQLKRTKRILLVLSGKGGVGKSVVSATLAALMADAGLKVGLMDADIYGPSSALLLNARGLPVEGEEGLTPITCDGVKVMSVDLFASGKPLPLTGSGARQVILELLALTNWGELDCLIVDMPPATGDIMMSFTSLSKKDVAAVVVTMPDRLSTTVARRVLELLRSGRVRTLGVLGNMIPPMESRRVTRSSGPRDLAREFGMPLLGLLHYDKAVPKAVEKGGVGSLLSTGFAVELRHSMHPYIAGLDARGRA